MPKSTAKSTTQSIVKRHPNGDTVDYVDSATSIIIPLEIWVEEYPNSNVPSVECVNCDLCGLNVKLSRGRNVSSLGLHRGRGRCENLAKQKLQRDTKRGAKDAVESLFPGLAQPTLAVPQSSVLLTTPATPRSTARDTEFSTPTMSTYYPVPNATARRTWDVNIPAPAPIQFRYQPLILPEHYSKPDSGDPSKEKSPLSVPALDHFNAVVPVDIARPLSVASSGSGQHPLSDHLSELGFNKGRIPTRNHPETEGQACIGQRIKWLAGSVFETYAYRQHAGKSFPWVPTMIEDSETIRVQSRLCALALRTPNEMALRTCFVCQRLVNNPRLVKSMEDAARVDPPAKVPYRYLSHLQLCKIVDRVKEEDGRKRLQILNFKRQMAFYSQRTKDQKQLVVYISQNKIPAASRVLWRSIVRGESPTVMLNKLVLTANGGVRRRGGWSEYDLDIANLIRLEGGPRLLYSLSKVDGYPSRSTLKRRKPIPELLHSVARPSEADFRANIEAFLGPQTGRKPPKDRRVGVVLMIDDLALEEVPRYDPQRNCVVGLCREHTQTMQVTVDSEADINALQTALKENTCHRAGEATVFAIAPITDDEVYFPSPVLVSGSCKAETGDDMAQWVYKLMKAYKDSPSGEAIHGPISLLDTDGASKFRSLRFLICHSLSLLDVNPQLFNDACKLLGLNTRCGPDGCLAGCDFRHILKRFATLLRSSTGIQIGTSQITPEHILSVLMGVKRMTREQALLLFSPNDKQNVPAAVTLLQTLLFDIDVEDNDLMATPTLLEKAKSVARIARILGYFLLPFIDVRMSLQEQLCSLSTYSHLLTGLYQQHGLGFMTGALFADSQAVVKSIFLTALRLQRIDPSLKYYILLDGTDRLEAMFGTVRTLDHGRNVDIVQLSHKLSIATEINAILERYPHLDQGHKRLNLVDIRGVDHINPKSWKGDVRVSPELVDIERAWNDGANAANDELEDLFGRRMDWAAYFSKPNVDHLRPEGTITYIGTSVKDTDFKDADDVIAVKSIEKEDESGSESDTDSDESESEDDEINITPSASAAEGGEISTAAIDAVEDNPSDHRQLNPLPPSKKASSYIVDDAGKKVSKHTVVARLVAESSRKAVNREFRVRGDTVGSILKGKKREAEIAELLDDRQDHVGQGDPGAILVRVEQMVCLALVDILTFRKGGAKPDLQSIPYDDLSLSSMSVLVQLMSMTPAMHHTKLQWLWSGTYLSHRAHPMHVTKRSKKDYTMRVPASGFYPLAPAIQQGADGKSTWVFEHSELVDAMKLLWKDLQPATNDALSNLKSLPTIDYTGESPTLPLATNLTGETLSLHVLDPLIASVGVKLATGTKVPCRLCNKQITVNGMRNHVGIHLLKSHRGVADAELYGSVEIGLNPCGWCGLEGCKTLMIVGKKGKAVQIESNCAYHYTGMVYSKAVVSNSNTPCTNVPIHCTLCPPNKKGDPPTFWKYNVFHHMAECHMVNGEIPIYPAELREAIHISLYEERLIGVDEEDTRAYREDYHLPDSDPPESSTAAEEAEPPVASPGRKRGMSSLSEVSLASRKPPPLKTPRLSTTEEQ
ncbi:hypothetical protein BKA70DRAFT_1512940 [Coprinopsis sp. MPI-PUGE-AT-0042]|nr:hypothetical protein BKA70DRAFT_1512940 [Coprinopsis sp. MPI-PUGE-AT-0042]